MRQALVLSAALGVLTVHGGHARAQDFQGFAAHEPNRQPCSRWASTTPADKKEFESWLAGFITGVNFGSGEAKLGSMSTAGLHVWIDQYCANNPDEQMWASAVALARELQRRGRP
jgi:hypothetical protein